MSMWPSTDGVMSILAEQLSTGPETEIACISLWRSTKRI